MREWQKAQGNLREGLQARDDGVLDVVRNGEQLQFSDWANLFLENYSKPPIRTEKTHEANERGCLHLNQTFGKRAVGDITGEDFEVYLRKRLQTREFRSELLAVSLKKTGSSRQPSIRNCGFFAV